MGSFDLTWGEHRLTFGTRPLIMGILNVTPDSFSDGGSFFSTQDAIAQAEALVESRLKSYEKPPMDMGMEQELKAYIQQRKQELSCN